MSQRMTNNTERVRFQAAADLTADQVVEVRDLVGMIGDDIATAKYGQLWIHASGVIQPADLNLAETWKAGDELYWNAAAGVVTHHQTHQRFGYAATDKAASATVEGGASAGQRAILAPHKAPNVVQYTIDFAQFADAMKADGDFTLHDFGQSAHIDAATIYTAGDDSLDPATATLALGDGTSANDQILSATALSTYDTEVATDITPVASTEVDKIVLRLASGPMVAGWLKIEIAYTLLGSPA